MGHDYGRGITNIDLETGIRFGIISNNKIMGERIGDFEIPEIPIHCESCTSKKVECLDEYDPDGLEVFKCLDCGEKFRLDMDVEYDGPLIFQNDEYDIQMDEYGDIWVFKSPWKVLAGHCSPCAPGAVYLTDSGKEAYGYALGPDWFEEGEIPYKLERVNKLYDIKDHNIHNVDELEKTLKESTIFDKIQFSGITKDQIKAKIDDLEKRQVPKREVLLDMGDEKVAEYWFKNWLHPMLKHAVPLSPKDKRGCSYEMRQMDAKQDMLHFYENGQQNFSYTLKDIKEWLNK